MLNGKDPAAVAAAAERQYQHHMAQGVSYNPGSQLQQQMPILPTNYADRPFQNIYMQQQQQQQNSQRGDRPDDSASSRQNSNGSVKAFACTNCGKGFARRSDLARHGKRTWSSSPVSLLIQYYRTDTQRRQASRLPGERVQQTLHTAICPHSAHAGSLRRETTHV